LAGVGEMPEQNDEVKITDVLIAEDEDTDEEELKKAKDRELEEDPWYTNIENGKIEEAKKQIAKRVVDIIAKHKLENFHVLILFDENRSISNYDANVLYRA
jgi:hypothetical protein